MRQLAIAVADVRSTAGCTGAQLIDDVAESAQRAVNVSRLFQRAASDAAGVDVLAASQIYQGELGDTGLSTTAAAAATAIDIRSRRALRYLCGNEEGEH